MEPAALAIGVVGLVNTVVKVSNLATILGESIHAIEVDELVNELHSFAAVLNTVEDLLSTNNHISYYDAITQELESAGLTANEMAQALHKVVPAELHGGAVRKAIVKIKYVAMKEKLAKLQGNLRHHTSSLGVLLNAAQMDMYMKTQPKDDTEAFPAEDDNREIIIAVMGQTGAGKSRFVREVTGYEYVRTGNSLTSVTEEVQAFSITIDNRVITLVDTPGFDDTFRSDYDILQEVATWLEVSYKAAHRISGIIYLQPITSGRVTGGMKRTFDVFEKLIGSENFGQVVLVTSKWDTLKDKGALTARFSGDRQSALQIVERISFDQRDTSNLPLAIQREMVDEARDLDQTTASEVLSKFHTMENRLDAEVKARQDAEAELSRKTEEYQRRIDVEQAQLKKILADSAAEKAQTVSRMQEDWEKRFKSLQNEVSRVTTDQEVDLPPPYTEVLAPRNIGWLYELAGRYTLDFILVGEYMLKSSRNLIKDTTHKLNRTLRPTTAEGYSRIEWVCSCGDNLYGDFIENAPGSLQVFAAQLGGTITHGPASRATSSQSSSSNIAPPPPAHIRTAQAPTTSWSSSIRTIGSSLRPSITDESFGKELDVLDSSTSQKRYLEICVRNSRYTHVLGEKDTSSLKTDREIFKLIKCEYNRLRISTRIFGFAVREPNAGHFVKFRVDKTVADGHTPHATAAVMSKPSMPPTEEVNKTYLYDPAPMDEPPMPPNIFMHYFTKNTAAHNELLWCRRFPQKLGDSLICSPNKLAVGWGVEIEESPNFVLFSTGMVLALLLSGLAAGLSGHYMEDKATGVAVGAWLTAVQTMVAATLFFKWT